MILRRTFFCAALGLAALLGTLSSARAGGINLSWDDCGSAGAGQRNFACDTNDRADILYASAVPPAPMTQLYAAVLTIEVVTVSSPITPWWSMQTGGCRANAMTADFNFTFGPFTCLDPWGGLGSGGGSYTLLFGNHARFRAAVGLAFPVSVDESHELYIARVALTRQKTTGAGSCAGCQDGACLALANIELDETAPLPSYLITNPISSQSVTWQNGGSIPLGCPAGVTSARTPTWGAVKALYR